MASKGKIIREEDAKGRKRIFHTNDFHEQRSKIKKNAKVLTKIGLRKLFRNATWRGSRGSRPVVGGR